MSDKKRRAEHRDILDKIYLLHLRHHRVFYCPEVMHRECDRNKKQYY